MRGVFLTLLVLVGAIARADMVPEGKKNIRYTFEVQNLAAFPDYTFIAYPIECGGILNDTPDGYVVVRHGEAYPVRMRCQSELRIYVLKGSAATVTAELDRLARQPRRDRLTAVANHSGALDPILLRERTDPLASAHDVLTVVNTEGNGPMVRRKEVVYTYWNGMIEHGAASADVRPPQKQNAETLPQPPDSGTPPPGEKTRVDPLRPERMKGTPAADRESPSATRRTWLAGAGILLISVGVLLIRRSGRRKS